VLLIETPVTAELRSDPQRAGCSRRAVRWSTRAHKRYGHERPWTVSTRRAWASQSADGFACRDNAGREAARVLATCGAGTGLCGRGLYHIRSTSTRRRSAVFMLAEAQPRVAAMEAPAREMTW